MTASPGRTGPAPATLVVLSGPGRGSRIDVPAGGLLFGRAAGSAGRLGDDPALSRWHARIDLAGEGLAVEDLASTNGTFLNGQRVSGRLPVRPGDVVTLGASQLQALPPTASAPAHLRTLATTVLPARPAAAPPPPAHAGSPAPAAPQPVPAAAHSAPPAPAAPRPAPAAAPPAAAHPAPEAAAPASATAGLTGRRKRWTGSACILLAGAGLAALWGGYARGWTWTGFRANGQLWDWLHLLLLPVILGTIPLWIQHKEYISRARRAVYGLVIVAWAGFVTAGYLIPLHWTGFHGQTLWDWLHLLLLPAALASTRALTQKGVRPARVLRSLRPHQQGIIAALAAGWVVSVIGGYALRWTWTGYSGNTLWDWLQLLLVPLVCPTLVYPALLKWVTGNAAERASQAAAARKAAAAGRTSPRDKIARGYAAGLQAR